MFVATSGGTEALLFKGGRLHPVWSNRTDGTSPVVAGVLLYVAGSGAVHVYVPTSGREVAHAADRFGALAEPDRRRRAGRDRQRATRTTTPRAACSTSSAVARSRVRQLVGATVLASASVRSSCPARRRVETRCISCASPISPRPCTRPRRRASPATSTSSSRPAGSSSSTGGASDRRRSSTSRRSSRAAASRGCSRWPSIPTTPRTRRFYVDYTDRNGDTRVVRYRSNGTAAIPASAKQLLFVKDFASNHNGGQLQFGPDGRLYWGNGDGGGGGDPQHNGQSLARPFAKIDAPERQRGGKPSWQLVAYGLRNPWRFSFDRANGDLYIGDVGQGNWEEIDYLRRGIAGDRQLRLEPLRGQAQSTTPSTALLTVGRYRAAGRRVSALARAARSRGGYVYRGKHVPSAVGRYFYGDYCSGTVWSLRIASGKPTRRPPRAVHASRGCRRSARTRRASST